MQKNLFDLVLTAEEESKVDDALKVLSEVLLPKLQVLTASRRQLLVLGDKSVAFVSKAHEVARQDTDLLDSFIDLEAFDQDVDAMGKLRSIDYKLKQLHSAVEDSFSIAGSEAYNAALMVYSLMKNAAKMGHPGAKDKVEELSARFPGRSKKKTDE
jgi:hypothetical protein